MSQELIGSLALSALITFGIIKLQTKAEPAKKQMEFVEPEDELDHEVGNLNYSEFLHKFNLPDNEDSFSKYKFIKKPDSSEGSHDQLQFDHKKIQKLKDSEKYDELSDYLDEKIRNAIDDPKFKHIKINDLRKLKSELMYN